MRKVIDLELGGEQRRVAFGFRSMCLAERILGQSLMSGEGFASARVLVAMVWAGLHDDVTQPWNVTELELLTLKPTMDTVCGWIEEAGPNVVLSSVMVALADTLVEKGGGDGEPKEDGGSAEDPPG